MQYGASMLRGLGADVTPALDGSCPAGYFRSCILAAPGKPQTCSCLLTKPTTVFSDTATATASTVNHHWGLIAAGIIGAFVIYKFAS